MSVRSWLDRVRLRRAHDRSSTLIPRMRSSVITPSRVRSQSTRGTCTRSSSAKLAATRSALRPSRQVVELGLQRRTELSCEPDGVVAARDRRTPAGHLGEPVEQLEVDGYLFDHPGAAHLHHDFCAIRQRRRVDLTDRRRSDRHGRKDTERLSQRLTERGLDRTNDVCRRHPRRRVLENRQCRLVFRRHQVRTRREHLPELDEGRAQLLERTTKVLRPRMSDLGMRLACAGKQHP